MVRLARRSWTQRWSGSYTFISCSYWGPEYYRTLKRILGVNFKHTLFVHRKGTVDFYVAADELDHLGRSLAKQASKITKFSALIRRNTDLLTRTMRRLSARVPSMKEYKIFLEYFDRHLAYHGFIKEPVDYMKPDQLKKYLSAFEQARKYSEKIYSVSEVFFRKLARTIARKEKRDQKLLTCLTQTELERYLEKRILPSDHVLKPRYENSCLYFENGRIHLTTGREALATERQVLAFKQTDRVKGISAYPGKVTGICRIVPDPHHYKKFNQGDILVTGMTRPEFLPLVSKAAAIVTDSGGVLSHAAITARELKKPCVTGTKFATKLFIDSDLLEVDANKGVVRKIR